MAAPAHTPNCPRSQGCCVCHEDRTKYRSSRCQVVQGFRFSRLPLYVTMLFHSRSRQWCGRSTFFERSFAAMAFLCLGPNIHALFFLTAPAKSVSLTMAANSTFQPTSLPLSLHSCPDYNHHHHHHHHHFHFDHHRYYYHLHPRHHDPHQHQQCQN